MADPFLSIGQLARRTGLAVSALRYYEAEGLISALRSPGGQRRFPRAEIRRVSFILIAQQFGFSLAEIRERLAALPDGRAPTEADWVEIAGAFRDDLNRRIEVLRRLRDDLDGCIGCGCLSLRRCKLYNPEDAAARNGPGPRYLMGDQPKS